MIKMSQPEPGELFTLLQSNDVDIDEVKALIHEQLNQTKDSSYLNSLVDYYMNTGFSRCQEVIVGICEPQDKYLFDKLHDCLKGSTRLKTLTLLSIIAHKQPPWLHKISQHPLLTALIKILKTDGDVSNLMTGVLLIVTLFSIIPSTIGTSYIIEICEIFTRISALNIKKSANVSEVIMMHLNVALYALFHRLYSLFPCNFLNYLRNYCLNNQEHLYVFNQAIRPMLDHVRMHPMLVTHTKDAEINVNRWKSMETHDIVVECLKLSLDPNEGTREDKCSSKTLAVNLKKIRYSLDSGDFTHFGEFASESSVPTKLLTNKDSLIAQAALEVGNWSPSLKCGLFTPPPETSPEFEVVGDSEIPTTCSHTTVLDSKKEYSAKEENTTSESCSQTPKAQSPLKMDSSSSKHPDSSNVQKADNFKTDAFSGLSHSKLYRIPSTRCGENDAQAAIVSKSEEATQVKTDKQDANDVEVATIFEKGPTTYELFEPVVYRATAMAPFHRNGRGSAQWCQSPFLEHIHDAQRGRSFSQGKRIPRRATVEASSLRGSITVRSCSLPNLALDLEKLNEEKKINVSNLAHEKQQLLPITRILNAALPQTYPNTLSTMYPSVVESTQILHPLFLQLSPPEILDRYLQLCSTVHELKVAQSQASGLSSNCGRSSHGHSDDVKLLRNELQLLHTQLLYERHKREIHAERNRRLLGKANRVKALEEQNNAMKDQMRLLEKEIGKISNSMLNMNSKLYDKENEIKRLLEMERQRFEEKATLEKLVAELQRQILAAKEEKLNINKDREHLRNQLFIHAREMKIMEEQVTENATLKTEITNLKREVMLMTELNRKYIDRIEELKKNRQYEEELVNLTQTYELENFKLKKSVETGSIQHECAKTRLAELENLLIKKDKVIVELKKSFQTSKDAYEHMVKIVEDKYSSRGIICQKLETEILKLHRRLELQLEPQIIGPKHSTGSREENVVQDLQYGTAGSINELAKLSFDSSHKFSTSDIDDKDPTSLTFKSKESEKMAITGCDYSDAGQVETTNFPRITSQSLTSIVDTVEITEHCSDEV